MIKFIIFDYDGVIVNTDPFNKYVLKNVLTERGIPFDDAIYIKFFSGRTLRDGFEGYLSMVRREQETYDFIQRKKSFDPEYYNWVEAYEDALRFIEQVRDGYRLAIVSGTRRIFSDAGLEKFGLQDAFDAVVTAEDYKEGKPNSDPYLTVLRILQLQPDEAVVIEDTPLGIKAAKAAGLFCIAVTHTHPLKELGEADFITDDLRKLPRLMVFDKKE